MDDGTDAVSLSGQVMGTPAYMSPEQAQGNVEALGPSTDIYSLGVILYELLAGRQPFGGSLGDVLYHVMHTEPDPPSRHRPDLDPTLDALCRRALAKDPADRPASMGELAVPVVMTECTGGDWDPSWASTFRWQARNLVVDPAANGSTGLLKTMGTQ